MVTDPTSPSGLQRRRPGFLEGKAGTGGSLQWSPFSGFCSPPHPTGVAALPGSGSGSGPRGTVRQRLSKQAIAGRAGGAETPSFAPWSFGDGGDDGSDSSGIGGGGS